MEHNLINSLTPTLQDVARRQLEKTKRVYLISPERMFSEYRGERENVKNYNGRQLLEMLQNADDASMAAKDGNRRVLVQLRRNTLVIANTGYPFSEDGLNSIFLSHLSPKDLMERQIGKKGLGFRSILSWAKEVTIKSDDLCVAFSERYSRAFLDELLLDESFSKEYKRLNKAAYSLPVATLACPDLESAVVDKFPGMDEFDTIIQIKLNDKAVPDLMKQIVQDIDSEVLLFLNYLEEIIIDINGTISKFAKTNIGPSGKRLITHTREGQLIGCEWNVHSISGRFDDLDKAYELSVAWQDGLENYKDVIYSFFRTKVAIKCKGIIHGSFELNADRNLIIGDDLGYNERLVKLIPSLLSKAAKKMAMSDNDISYEPLSLLQVELNSLAHLVEPKDLYYSITEAAKAESIFPVTSKRYISWDDEDAPVFYGNCLFSKYLDPSEYRDLLLYTDNSEIISFINNLSPVSYKLPDVIASLSKLKDSVSLAEYAQIILAIYDQINNSSVHLFSSLLVDSNFNLLSFTQAIFFPSFTQYSLPSTLGIQVISSALAQELLTATQSKNYAELSGKLSAFRIREFQFKEIVELLIKHYSSKERPEDIATFHEYLFLLYSNEKPVEERWNGNDVWFLNKKNKKALAKNLYFGKEYGNSLIEEIYSFNKNKILVGPQRFKVLPEQTDNWTLYCRWLGVASMPRFIPIKAGTDYAEYVMRHFDYRNKIGEYIFKNGYKEFKSELTQGYGSIFVLTIDDLLGILNNNPPEKILQFLSEYPALFSSLEKDIEPGTESQIHFWFYNTKASRTIRGSLMRSYIKWILRSHPWLNVEGDKREKPDMCCTAAYITEDFRGLVEKPVIDFETLRAKSISRDKVDFLLSVVGVHKGINTFSTSMLYSILLKLPDLDSTGRKTKSIYNQLSVNYDDRALDRLDPYDENNIKFKKQGKVWCQRGFFQPIQQVYYVNDKHYGDTIINQFNTIAIDRRRGKEKIRKIFGVTPLDGIDLTMAGTSPLHPLNALFEQEMQAFKPYVYVLRMEVDGGSEKAVIKDTKFQLVTQLDVLMHKDEREINLSLSDYEYFYQKARNTVYIKVNKGYDNVAELRDDIYFCSVVAEVFSIMLDVDAQRQQIRELFSKSMTSREELLAAELDHNNLQKLIEARELLGITTDPKIDFWRAFCKCQKGRKFPANLLTDEALLEFLKLRHPTFSSELELIFYNLNYDDLNEEVSLELIVNFFKKVNLSLSQFNTFYYPSIDVNELYRLIFKRQRDNQKDRFKELFYQACQDGLASKSQFLQSLQQYDQIQPTLVADVDFNAKEDLKAAILNKFAIDLDNVQSSIDLNKIYNDNLNDFLKISYQSVADVKLVQRFVDDHIQVRSLLHFDHVNESLLQQLIIWTGSQPGNGNNNPPKSNRVTFGGNVILYDTYLDLLNELSSIVTDDLITRVLQVTINTERKDSSRIRDNGKRKFGGGMGRNRTADAEAGFLGEYLVYRKMLATAEPGSVVWVSEYARDCGVNSEGKDGLGYDIRYTPKGQKSPKYVEVKTVGWDDAFVMTSTEINFAEEYSKHYEMFLVRNLQDVNSLKIEVIKKLFDYGKQSSFTDNNLFSVINDNFILKFKKK